MNQASAALRPGGRAAACTYWADEDGIPQYRLIHSNWPGQWQSTRASNFASRFRLALPGTLPVPHSRPELLMTDSDHALIIYRSVEHGNRLVMTTLPGPHFRWEEASYVVLVDEDLGFYEPVVSHAAWDALGDLILYVQRCEQFQNGDEMEHRAKASAWIGRWNVTRHSPQ